MPGPQESVLVKYNYPIGFTAAGIISVALMNYRNRKPPFSGLHLHAIWGTLGGLFGYQLDQALDRKYAERDAQIRHYIETHPEDFAVNRKKYKEIFEEWIPIR